MAQPRAWNASGSKVIIPKIDDEQYKRQAAADAFNAAGLAGAGGFAGSAAVADAGSLGVFIGRKGAENMAKAGRPTALKALDMAERHGRQGHSSKEHPQRPLSL